MEKKRIIRQRSELEMRAAVKEVEGGALSHEVAIKYQVHYHTILKWVIRFGDKVYLMSKKRAKVSDHQKRVLVKKILDGEMTPNEATLAYGLKNPQTIKRWIKKASRYNGDIDLKESPMLLNNSDFKQALDQANLKVLALETIIDVAEEQFKIKIRKKAGAKQ